MLWKQPNHPPFYNVNEILERNDYKVIISIGERGVGKSLGWKLQGFYDALNNNGRTIYIRRFKKELKEAQRNFLNDLYKGDERLKDEDIKIKGDTITINDSKAFTFIPLSQASKMKSIAYDDVVRVIFDEFLTLDRTLDSYGYDEIMLFTELLDTIFRIRDNIQIVLLANAISTTSNYFELFGFDKPINLNRRYQHPNKNIIKNYRDVVLEIIKNESYREKKEESALMSVINSDKYKRYAIENEFAFDNFDNVVDERKIRGHHNILYQILTNNMVLTLKTFNEKKLEYIITDSEPLLTKYKQFTFDKEMVVEGGYYITSSSRISNELQAMIISNRLKYSSMKVKKEFLLNLKKIVRTYF